VVGLAKVIKETASLGDNLKETAAGMIVFLVNLEMVR